MAGVVFEGVSKLFGDIAVVRDLNLEVRESEFLVLLGPSGCGKTTTLRMVAGFIVPSAGTIRIGGEDVTRLPPRARNIGMVFQDYALFPNMTVAENIGFGLRERKVEKSALDRRVAELLELIRLPHLAGRFPSELSGGQQQRVALARALAYSPRVLLMDEPLGALDLKLREAMQIELHRMQRELRITTIFVTHDQEEAMGLSDRIVVMADGQVQQVGSPEDLYTRPANPFVANFIGKINFLSGEVAAVEGGRCTVRLADQATVSGIAQDRCQAGQRAQIAIRPEALRLIEPGSAEFANRLPGRVKRRRFFGNIVHYSVATASGQELLVESTTGAGTVALEQTVWIGWQPELTLIYPGAATAHAAQAASPSPAGSLA
ncbi:MAG: ABC transporter ATP-binding protein [Alphaproteobacteria bacterium]|nr:ABC transporter ATP-binding protein [Alphaproteobacteria bacterium]